LCAPPVATPARRAFLDPPARRPYNGLMIRSALVAAALLAAAPALAADPAGIDAGRLSQHVKVLASDEFEGRGPATEGERKTIAYLTAQFRALGLQPGGDKGPDGRRAWTQAVPLARFEIAGPISAGFSVNGQSQAVTQGQ
jgi:hypothetical protein